MGYERRRKLLSVPKGQWVFFTGKRGLKAHYKSGPVGLRSRSGRGRCFSLLILKETGREKKFRKEGPGRVPGHGTKLDQDLSFEGRWFFRCLEEISDTVAFPFRTFSGMIVASFMPISFIMRRAFHLLGEGLG